MGCGTERSSEVMPDYCSYLSSVAVEFKEDSSVLTTDILAQVDKAKTRAETARASREAHQRADKKVADLMNEISSTPCPERAASLRNLLLQAMAKRFRNPRPESLPWTTRVKTPWMKVL